MIESSRFEEIRELVRDSKLELALEELQKLIDEFNDIESKNIVILIQSSFKTLKKKTLLRLINLDEENIEKNKIANSILDFISQLESEKIKLNHKKETKQLPSASKIELLEAAKSAIILIELEKIKYRYYHADLYLRENILNELRVYKSISTDITTIEIYNFLFEVADSISYYTSGDYGAAIFSHVMHFFPDETDELDAILNLSINIGSQLVDSSVFNLENFKIGVYGLSIWKWVYLKAKQQDKKEIIDIIKLEYKRTKKYFYEDNVKISNYEGKLRLIEIFEKDLEKKGLQFPIVPDEIFELI